MLQRGSWFVGEQLDSFVSHRLGLSLNLLDLNIVSFLGFQFGVWYLAFIYFYYLFIYLLFLALGFKLCLCVLFLHLNCYSFYQGHLLVLFAFVFAYFTPLVLCINCGQWGNRHDFTYLVVLPLDSIYWLYFISLPLDVTSTSHSSRVQTPCLLLTCRKPNVTLVFVGMSCLKSHFSSSTCCPEPFSWQRSFIPYVAWWWKEFECVPSLSFTDYWNSCRSLVLVVEIEGVVSQFFGFALGICVSFV